MFRWGDGPNSDEGVSNSADSDEVDDYLSSAPVEIDDLLEYWKSKETVFGQLAKVARKVLCVLASSCDCERLFSAAGNTKTKNRNQLSPEQLDRILRIQGYSD